MENKKQRIVLNLNTIQAEGLKDLLQNTSKNDLFSEWNKDISKVLLLRIERTLTKHKISEKLGHKPSKEEMHTAMEVAYGI